MTADELKSHVVRAGTGLLAYAAGRYHFSVDQVGAITSDIGYVGSAAAFLYGGYLHWGMKKVPDTAIVTGANTPRPNVTGLALAFLCLAGLLLAGNARAADLKPVLKAPAVVGCTVTSCTGFFVGGTIANAGGNIDIIGSGVSGLASNGLNLGAQAGYEYFNNNFYFAPFVKASYDISLTAPGSGITDKIAWGGGVRLGYSLANIFGAVTTTGATPTLSADLLKALMTPYVTVSQEKRHGQPTLGTGAGVEALLAADPNGHSSWTVNADYMHYAYRQGGDVSPVAVQKDENYVGASVNKHFGF
jgi:hypothetical protein